ncbi:MAG: hypothetical protein JWM80_2929 [Cyanobacteria bacterium RYN_339]|nr:hypothetical protein [Cyanobacteria bacterium RYN_339]
MSQFIARAALAALLLTAPAGCKSSGEHQSTATSTETTSDSAPSKPSRATKPAKGTRTTTAVTTTTTAAAPVAKVVVVKRGASIAGKLADTLDSGKNTDGDTFTVELAPGMFGDKRLKGAVLEGHIEGVQSAAKLGKKGAMNVVFDDLRTSDGTEIPVDAKLAKAPKPEGKMLRNMALMVGGAVAGHHIAKATGKKHGALAGAAAAGALALAMPGGNVVIKKGTKLDVTFTSNVMQ